MRVETRSWKLGDEAHRRTFLLSPGTYRDGIGGAEHRGELAFWGEWEGGVDLISEVDPIESGPRWLCRPDPRAPYPRSEDGTPPQNTDPFVWGDRFRYTFCRQRGNGKLRRLGRGSLVLFGSSLQHRFVLDTVLVVAGWVEHRKPRDLIGRTDDAHMRATIDPMYGWGDDKRTYRLYFGATPDDPVEGMFSFVPARPAAGSASGFARPAIYFDDLINPDTRMQARVRDVGIDKLPQLWQAVTDAVTEEGLVLATELKLS